MNMGTIIEVAGMALLATLNVALWTLRVAQAAAGRRLLAALVGGVEALLFALVFGAVVSALDDPLRIAAYGVGVAAGTLVGIIADERLSPGQSVATVVVDGDGRSAAETLHEMGWPVVGAPADGVRGTVAVLTVVVEDSVLGQLTNDVATSVPDGFMTIGRLTTTRPIPLPDGMHVPRSRSSAHFRK